MSSGHCCLIPEREAENKDKAMEWIKSKESRDYFENEWCKPTHDDAVIFEFLVLEMMQAGLSWETILQKREAMRAAFDGFDYKKIAEYSQADVDRLMNNPKIIRNKLKINAVINNAKRFVEVQKEYGSFDRYIWSFTDNKTIDNKLKINEHPQAQSAESLKMSKDLKKRGFKFTGAVICYSFMQAVGMVNDIPLAYR